ncbi:MAG: hypothetical protein M3N54_05565, partial [Acidobacteriota bacterium]|nr:hypothetical protein [Acidobacteriota bacterium]
MLLVAFAGQAQSSSPWRFWDSRDGFIESYTGSLALNPSGGVWAKHGRLGNIEFLNGYTAPHFPDPHASGQLECAPDGTLWMWSGKGLSRFADGKWMTFYMDEVVRSGSLRQNSAEGWDFTS